MIDFKIENLGQLRSLRRQGILGRRSEVADRSRVDACAGNPQPSEPVPFAAVRRAGANCPASRSTSAASATDHQAGTSVVANECLVAGSHARESCAVPDPTGQQFGFQPLPGGTAAGRAHTRVMWSRICRTCCAARVSLPDST